MTRYDLTFYSSCAILVLVLFILAMAGPMTTRLPMRGDALAPGARPSLTVPGAH